MKADNQSTDHNRTVHITNIKPHGIWAKLNICNLPTELTITINYKEDGPGTTLEKAVTLDSVVIPAIIKALNE